METVSFTRMADGTREDYLLLEQTEAAYNRALPDRLLAALRRMEDDSLGGYQVSRLQHCLQGATRACRDGRDDEYVAAVLLHDIGDELAPVSHSELAAAVLRPYVSDKLYWIVKHHGLFQMIYYAHFVGGDRNARDHFRDHPWYEDTVEFCELYDQNCFDPDYDSLPLEFFAPMLEQVFSRPPRFSELQLSTGAGGHD
jgi:predicted HD phosphohydrolase